MRIIHHTISLTALVALGISAILLPQRAWADSVSMPQIYALAQKSQIGPEEKAALDITGSNGETALCQSISNKDYKTYHYLKSLGADTHHPCVKKIPENEWATFEKGYNNWIQASQIATTTGLSTGTMVGIGAGVVAVAGVAAAAGGGGGGGGGSSKESKSSSAFSSASSVSSGSSISSVSSVSSGSVSSISQSSNSSVSSGSSISSINSVSSGSISSISQSSASSVSSGSSMSSSGFSPSISSSGNYTLTTAEMFDSGDTHYRVGRFLPAINAAKAYEKFIRVETDGKKIVSYDTSALEKVRVAVMDVGVNTGNQNINFATENGDIIQFNYQTAVNSHATAVAGIIAGKWGGGSNTINGVAPNAEIVDWMIAHNGDCGINNSCKGFQGDTFEQVQTAHPRIYNLSWSFYGYNGATSDKELYWASSYNTIPTGKKDTNFNLTFYKNGSFFKNFLDTLADTNSVLVLASANKSNDNNTQLLSAAPLVLNGENGTKNLTNLMIVAVALDLKKQDISSSADIRDRAEYSNGCGVAAAYCLSAPAGNNELGSYATKLYSLGLNTTSDKKRFNGTSAAAPIISGSLAFIMGAYPYLTSQQAVEILFRSANKNIIGTDGHSNVFNATGVWKDSFNNKYAISSTFGHGLVDLGAATDILGELSLPLTEGASSVGDLNAIPKTAVKQTKLALPKTLGGNLTLELPQQIMGLDDYNRPFAVKTSGIILKPHHSSEAFHRYFKTFMSPKAQTFTEGDNQISFRFSAVNAEQHLLGMDMIDFKYALNNQNTLLFSYRADTKNQIFDSQAVNPFMDMKNGYSIAGRFKFNKTISFQFGTTIGKNGFYEGDEDRNEKYNRSVYAFTSEMDYQIYQDITLRFIGGMIREKEASLGINGTGAFGTESSRTYFTGGITEYKPFSKLTLTAAYYYGKTETPKGGSLIALGDLISDGFSFNAQYDLDPKTKTGIRFSSPLKIKKGYAWLRLPYARDMYADKVYYDKVRLNLSPATREYDVGLYYQTEQEDYLWRGEMTTRFHPDHVAGAKPDYRALWSLDWKF